MAEQAAIEETQFTLPAPIEELCARRDGLLAGMREAGVDVAVIQSGTSAFYLSGVHLGSFTFTAPVLILAADGTHRVVCRRIEEAWAELWASQSWAREWSFSTDEQRPADVIADAVRAVHPGAVRRLAADGAGAVPGAELAAMLGADALVALEPLLHPLRVVKSETELGHIRAAGRLTALGTDAAVQTIRDGGTDTDATAAALTAMVTAGSWFPGLGPVVAAGPDSARSHVMWLRRVPRQGEAVTSMMSGFVHGYGCPLERTFVVGDPTPETAAALESIVEVVEHVMGEIRPGLVAREVNAIGREAYAARGLEQHFLNRLGYTVGLNWAELDLPQLKDDDTTELREGMTFHLVPGLLIPGMGMLCRSQPVVVTGTGCEPLSDYPLRVDTL